MDIIIVQVINGIVLGIYGEIYVVYYKGELIQLKFMNDEYIVLNRIKLYKGMKLLFAKVRLFDRLLRLSPKAQLNHYDDTLLISINKKILYYDIFKNEIKLDHLYRNNMNNCISILKRENSVLNQTEVYYGEYWGNLDREKVSIFKRSFDNWNKVYSFEKNEIQHIHGIFNDFNNENFIVLTGDSDNESKIWRFSNDFQKKTVIFEQKQLSRACIVFSESDGYIYATDSPDENNFIIRLKDGEIVDKHQINGPCIYGAKYKDQYIFTTTVEPTCKLKGIRYLLSTKLGQGVKNKSVCFTIGNFEEGFTDYTVFKKDFLPFALFQFGNASVQVVENEKYVVICPTSVEMFDNKSIVFTGDIDLNNIANYIYNLRR